MAVTFNIAERLLDPNATNDFRDQVANGQSLNKIYKAAKEIFSRQDHPSSLFSGGNAVDSRLTFGQLEVLHGNLKAAVNEKIAQNWDASIIACLFDLIFSWLGFGVIEETLAMCGEIDELIKAREPTLWIPNPKNGEPIQGYHDDLQRGIEACKGFLNDDEMEKLRELQSQQHIPVLSTGSLAVYRRNIMFPRTVVVQGSTPFLLLNRTDFSDPLLGGGSFSRCKFAINLKTGSRCMLICRKFDKTNADKVKYIQNAADYSKKLKDCPYFPRLHSHVVINSHKKPNVQKHWLIFEYCIDPDISGLCDNGGHLGNLNYLLETIRGDVGLLNPIGISFLDLYQVYYDILKGIECLQTELGSVHGDLKPANIVYYRDKNLRLRAKIIDLEGAVPFGQFSGINTPHYCAPERYNVQALSAKADIYSLGRILEDIFILGLGIPALPQLACDMMKESPDERPAIATCIDRFEKMFREKFQGQQLAQTAERFI